jgi:hypothetical protein
VNLREIFVENFAGDLEYHPRRAVVYLILAVAAFCFLVFSPSEVQFTALRPVASSNKKLSTSG